MGRLLRHRRPRAVDPDVADDPSQLPGGHATAVVEEPRQELLRPRHPDRLRQDRPNDRQERPALCHVRHDQVHVQRRQGALLRPRRHAHEVPHTTK